MKRVGIQIAIALFLAFGSATSTFAQWVPGGLGAGTGVPVSDGSGGVIATAGSDGSGTHLTKRTAAVGAVQWSATVIIGPVFQFAAPSAAAPDRSGGVVYTASANIGGDIYADRISSTGAHAWGATAIAVCNAANPQNQPSIATDASGNSFIVWHDERNGQGTVNQFFAQKLDPSGVPQWSVNGVQITPVGSLAYSVATATPVPDEAGGCYFIWEDSRPGTLGASDIYAQRITAAGSPAWTAGGLPVCVITGQQFFVRAIRDGSGGMIAMWMDKRNGADFDLYAQRVDNTGASLWAANGIPIAAVSSDQNQQIMIEDGLGGAFMAWTDSRNSGVSGADIYAQHINGAGTALWTANGAVVSNSAAGETDPNIISDGAGGAIVAWLSSATSPSSARAGHLNASGVSTWESGGLEFPTGEPSRSFTPTLLVSDGLGGALIGGGGILSRALSSGEQAWVPNYRATIASIADVSADEGGWVTVNTTKPFSDGGGISPITNGYSLWRKRVPGATTARLSDDRHVLPSTTRMADIAKYSDFPPGQWDAVAYTPAIVAPSYSFLAPTHTDSSFQSIGTDSFLVVAHTTTSSLFVVSATAGGHSVDNLPPGAPQNLVGGSSGGTTVQLQWSPSSASDIWHYSVYKGTSPSFVPSSGNRIGQPIAASLQDATYDPGVSHYKVSATDRHGNESGYTLLAPSQITGVPPGTIPAHAFLSRPIPNPFHGATSFEFGVATHGRVTLRIYDLRGRAVARVLDEARAPGVWRVSWNGSDDTHRALPAGIYWARFETAGTVERTKVVLTN